MFQCQQPLPYADESGRFVHPIAPCVVATVMIMTLCSDLSDINRQLQLDQGWGSIMFLAALLLFQPH